MGTNFFYRIPPKESEIDELHKKIDRLKSAATDYYDIKEFLDVMEKKYNIHLGKRSYGWQFLWDYHDGNFFKDNLKSIKEFLQKNKGTIVDEYEHKYTIDEFLNDEITLYRDKDHCDAMQYHLEHPTERLSYNIAAHEFISKDGLRFSKDEDFS